MSIIFFYLFPNAHALMFSNKQTSPVFGLIHIDKKTIIKHKYNQAILCCHMKVQHTESTVRIKITATNNFKKQLFQNRNISEKKIIIAAFDCMNHKLTLDKIQCCGFYGTAMGLIYDLF